ncbi:MAG: tetratricopeptide repeat protein [bacterium]|nr:tetratricopeptide repeat protein [bacterium]
MKRISIVLLSGAAFIAPLTGQNSADSLYQRVLSRRQDNRLSRIMIDQAIAVEKQQAVPRPDRLAGLYLMAGNLMHEQKRLEEAVSAYSSSLDFQGDSATVAAAHFGRGAAYDTLGSRRARKRVEERLLTSQMVWFGQSRQAAGWPPELGRAEADYRAVYSLEAAESLMQLLLVSGRTAEAEDQMRIIRSRPEADDRSVGERLLAYEILLCEARENFAEAERLLASASGDPGLRLRLNAFLDRLRSRRLERLVRFEWTDRTDLETAVSAGRLQSGLETAPQALLQGRAVTKRYLFEGEGGGFLISAKADAFGLFHASRGGAAVNADLLGTFLGPVWSMPGAGMSLGLSRFGGDGRRVIRRGHGHFTETGSSDFGFNLNAGVRHKLLATLSYGQAGHWMRGLSGRLSRAQEMFAGLGVSPQDGRPTDGVYSMGFAGSGWWPGKTRLAVSDFGLGVDTRLTAAFTAGAAALVRTAELTDHMEWTAAGAGRTYAHRIILSERTGLLRLNAAVHLDAAGFRMELGGHHTFRGAGRVIRNDRSSQVVESDAGPDGVHRLYVNEIGSQLSGSGLEDARTLAAYLPSASGLTAGLQRANWFMQVRYQVNGLRARNRDWLVTLGVKPRRRTLSQCLHDLAPSRH